MRLIRWVYSLLVLGALVWFATMVKLGNHTLYGHLRAIFATRAAHDLADGAKQEAKKIADRLRHEDEVIDAGAPLDPVRSDERRDLDKLVKEKTRKKDR